MDSIVDQLRTLGAEVTVEEIEPYSGILTGTPYHVPRDLPTITYVVVRLPKDAWRPISERTCWGHWMVRAAGGVMALRADLAAALEELLAAAQTADASVRIEWWAPEPRMGVLLRQQIGASHRERERVAEAIRLAWVRGQVRPGLADPDWATAVGAAGGTSIA